MKKFMAVLLCVLIIPSAFAACSINEHTIDGNKPLFEAEQPSEENSALSEDALSTGENEEVNFDQKPLPEDFDSIVLFDEDSSPIVEMTKEERAEFLEIIGSYELFETEEIDPALGTMDRNVSIRSKEKGAVIYSKELSGKGLVTLKWNKEQNMVCYSTSGDLYYDLADFRNRIQKNARNDGRWPFLIPEEESFLYSETLPEFDEEHFRLEFDTFIFCVTGDYDYETNRLGPEKAEHYCLWKVLKDYNAKKEVLPADEDGRTLVPEKDVDRIAKYVFGIADFSGCRPSENGYYAAPFGARIINYKITDIRTDGSYVFCEVLFTDPGDAYFEWEPCAKKTYTFIRFEAEGEVFYRAVSSRCEFGEEYGF